MSRACYEPKAALSMLAKLGEHEHKHAGVPAMLRTHPMAKERVQVSSWQAMAVVLFDRANWRQETCFPSCVGAWWLFKYEFTMYAADGTTVYRLLLPK